ncbi:MAG: hypothetical protein KBC96_03775, partial [Armatimonadetes bacterium]|nr:hypothetical protein [Armatimonadota bacterium]
GTWYGTPEFTFTAVGGFGAGTVAGYRYAWVQSAGYTFTGAEPIWNTSDLVAAASADGGWYLHVQGLNAQGDANGTLALGPYNFDGTPPENPTSAVEVGGAADGEWQSLVSDPSFTWSGASDALSGIGGYYVYFGEADDGTSENQVTAAAYDPPAADTGTYYLRVCAVDGAGNRSPDWVTLFTFKYDGTAPVTTVIDDGPYTADKDRLHVIWYASDAETGIVEYRYAVGTAVGGDDVVAWTSAGTAEEAAISIPEPGLQEGLTYYVSVMAKNGAGAWGDVGSSDGIQLSGASMTISAAKALADGTPVTLAGKTISADFMNSYYIQELDRSSGILVMGAGPKAGSLVTIGGVMGANAMGERAIMEPVTSILSIPESGSGPDGVLMLSRNVGGGDLNAWTFGVTGGIGPNNVGLLVKVIGRVSGLEDYQFFVEDGSSGGPIKVIAYGVDLSGLSAGDTVIVTGISSLEYDGSGRKALIRVASASGVQKKN